MLLFKSRLQKQWKAHLALFRSIGDWALYIYLIIPFAAFIYYLLRETVFQLNYGLIESIHPGILIFLLLIIATFLINRTFSEPADKLFLLQNRKQYAALKRCSFYYSLLVNFLYMAILYSLFYPLLKYVHALSSIQLIQFAISLMSCYLVSKIILLQSSKWAQFCFILFLVVLFTTLVFYANVWTVVFSSLIGIVGGGFYEKRAIQTHRYFEKQTENDVEAFYRWQSRIFFINPELKTLKLPVHKAKAPILCKQSKSNNQVTVLIELMLKTILRKKSYLWNYVRIIAIVFPLMFVLPWWGAYLLIIFMYFGLNTYMSAILDEIKENAIFKIIPASDQNWAKAMKRVEIYMINPVSFVYLVIITCILFF